MAPNIQNNMSADKTLYVFDIVHASCNRFQNGFGGIGPVRIVKSPKEAVSAAAIVVSMVPGPNQVRTVYLSDVDGVIAGPESPGKILLDFSTVDIETAKEVAAVIMKARCGIYVDAPVSLYL
ncbi:hypothetical protein H9Q72_012432 [Fusarium xylarioides]|uniref:6-phosphogluconate dehydrogenase NADP-binding domain-containing protein n=1 Tax=Fusarium xylarioides TaxID=221167 RepID=A0A9P7KW39_9HYPO|nr:hypothetical protein H9Q72_012432 [Fusarium xylarioides]KAG5806362.1 hypothetical protein H9Q71_009046 [Fusarium xylarioides]KAG5820084.1 hypothetical protein H9Q74_009092 [Fusarium xylarioides]